MLKLEYVRNLAPLRVCLPGCERLLGPKALLQSWCRGGEVLGA